MTIDKSLLSGSTTLLILNLLNEKEMYGYQMIETLAQKSDDTFSLKAGTLYPILHDLEKKELVTSYEDGAEGGRIRKYYKITEKGKKQLAEKKAEWEVFAGAVNTVLKGGHGYALSF